MEFSDIHKYLSSRAKTQEYQFTYKIKIILGFKGSIINLSKVDTLQKDNFPIAKLLMQGKLFDRCMYFLYCSVLSLGGKVNARRIPQPGMESILKKIIYEIFWS